MRNALHDAKTAEDVCRAVLDGVDVHAHTELGLTALMCAAQKGAHAEAIIRALIAACSAALLARVPDSSIHVSK